MDDEIAAIVNRRGSYDHDFYKRPTVPTVGSINTRSNADPSLQVTQTVERSHSAQDMPRGYEDMAMPISSPKVKDNGHAFTPIGPERDIKSIKELRAMLQLQQHPVPVGNESSGESASHSPLGFNLPTEEESKDTYNSTPYHKSKSDNKLLAYGKSASKRDVLKAQKKHYRNEKKRATKELLHTLKDPSVVVMSDWMKVRGTLKGWTKLYWVLKPGLLVLYKSSKQKTGHWVGTILLNTCELIERPSKKDGFCFKLFHPLDQSIWAPRGPKGETIGAITQPLPYSYLIFRAPSESAGKCWMDALELALRCSSLLMKSMIKDGKDSRETSADQSSVSQTDSFLSPTFRLGSVQLDELECEKHFQLDPEEDFRTDKEEKLSEKGESDSSSSESEDDRFSDDLQPLETPYIENKVEELGQQGDACQTEEVADENKSLIWTLVKQVRPGMDLSKVVLPTFILEPRSFLDKLSDFYYHADLLSEAVKQDDAYSRMQEVVRWYLSGFYKKPKGLKKPYNPIIGETFRCYWKHAKTNSRTFYIAEQISHHPPVTAFYVTNRRDGFSVSGSILAKSKFYGNSLSAVMDGVGRLSFLKRGEDYLVTMPYAHCKGILIGTLTMEMGGKVSITCEKTGYRADLDFKLKPFLSSSENANRIAGKIKLGSETLATLEGHWDQDINFKDKSTGESRLFWSVTDEVKKSRLKRYSVPLDQQKENESERLWMHVSEAIVKGQQEEATNEKFILEDKQRKEAKERKIKMEEWLSCYFEQDIITGDWIYKYADSRPWDPINDVLQYEKEFVIQTKTRHRTPLVRTTSIMSVEIRSSDKGNKRQTSVERTRKARLIKASPRNHKQDLRNQDSGSSTPDHHTRESDSDSEDGSKSINPSRNSSMVVDREVLHEIIKPLAEMQKQTNERIMGIQTQLVRMERGAVGHDGILLQNRDWMILGLILLFQTILHVMYH